MGDDLVTMPKKKTVKSAPAMPAKPAPNKGGRPPAGGVNKSQFIRDQDPSLSAKEVVAKAKAAGFELSEGMVYTTRSQAKKATQKAAGGTEPKKLGRPPKSAGSSGSPSVGSAESQVKKLAWTIGFPQLEAIVAKLKREAGL